MLRSRGCGPVQEGRQAPAGPPAGGPATADERERKVLHRQRPEALHAGGRPRGRGRRRGRRARAPHRSEAPRAGARRSAGAPADFSQFLLGLAAAGGQRCSAARALPEDADRARRRSRARGPVIVDPRDAEGQDRGATDRGRGRAPRRAPLPAADGLRREDARGWSVIAPARARLLLLARAAGRPAPAPRASVPREARSRAGRRARRSRSSGPTTSRPTPRATRRRRRARCARSGAPASSATSRASTRVGPGPRRARRRASSTEGRATRPRRPSAPRSALAPGLPDGHAGLALALLRKGPLGVVPSVDAARRRRLRLPRDRPRRAQRARPRDGRRSPGRLRGRLGHRGGAPRCGVAACCSTTSRSGSARPSAAPASLGALPAAAAAAGRDLPGLGLAAAVVARAALRLPRRPRAGGSPASSLVGALRGGAGRRRRSRCGCAPRATRSTTRRSPRSSPSPTPPAIARLEQAVRSDPEDRDLVYLLGAGPTRAGRYEEAAELYRQLLAADPADAVARNNLANIEFVRGSYDAARARYRAGTEAGAEAGGGGDLVLQPLARAPAEVRLPGLQRGEVERRPPRPGPRGRLRPLEVRHARLRGRGPRPDPRAGPGQVRRKRSRGSRCGTSPRAATAGRDRGALLGSLANRFVALAGGLRPGRASSSGAGAGRRRSRCTAAGAGRPSAAAATWGR